MDRISRKVERGSRFGEPGSPADGGSTFELGNFVEGRCKVGKSLLRHTSSHTISFLSFSIDSL